MAKTRKTARKSTATRKSASKATRKTSRPRGSASPGKELDLRPLKKQLKAHVEQLNRSKSSDARVQSAITSLQRLQAELNEACLPTMTIPLQ